MIRLWFVLLLLGLSISQTYDCNLPTVLSNNVTVTGITDNSIVSSRLDCSAAPSTLQGEVYFRYTRAAVSDLINVEIAVIPDTATDILYLNVYTGPCTALQCTIPGYSSPTTNPSFSYPRIVLDGSISANLDLTIVVSRDAGPPSPFSITVTEVPAPPNESCVNAEPIVSLISGALTGTNQYSVSSFTDCNANPSGPTVYYKFVTQFTDSSVEISTCGFGADINPVFSVLFGTCGSLVCDATNTDRCAVIGPQIVSGLPAGTTIYIAVHGFDEGEFALKIQEIGPFIAGCGNGNRIVPNGLVQGSTVNAEYTWDQLTSCSTPPVASIPASPVSFYLYTTRYSYGDLRIDTCGSSTFNTYLTVFTGSCSALSCLAEETANCANNNAQVILPEADRLPYGTDVIILVHSADTSSGTFTISVTETEVIIPDNSECQTANQLFNQQTVYATTQFSTTLRDAIPTCGGTLPGNQSPTIFYYYYTEYQYSDIIIDTCQTPVFNTEISIFLGNCSNLICVGSNDNGCGSSSAYTFSPDEKVPQGTQIFIAVHGGNTGLLEGYFSITVTEIGVPEPSNGDCFNPMVLSPSRKSITASNAGSGTLSTSIASCSPPTMGSPVVFFSYRVESQHSDLEINTCSGASFDTVIEVFTGDCNSLSCLAYSDNSCGSQSSVTLSNLPVGTDLIIAVYGANGEVGTFSLFVAETFYCSPEGPVIHCATTFSIYTDKKCGNNQQCATIPPVELGYCDDLGTDCECTMVQLSGVSGGEIVPSGFYEIKSYAVNDDGFQSDICTYRITVVDTCNPQGPETICQDHPLALHTSQSCSDDPSKRCAVMQGYYLSRCHDYNYCSCSVFQVSGPLPGEELLPGSYFVGFSSVNAAGYTSPAVCTTKIVVT